MSIMRVAALAKVSIATVSRVINGHPTVAPDSLAKVKKAMKTLGFVPRAVRPGRVPRSAMERGQTRTGVLGVVLMGRSQAIFNNPYMARLLSFMTQAARETNRHLMIIEMPSPQDPPCVISEKRVDGVILTGQPDHAGWVESLGNFPKVVFGTPSCGVEVDVITSDSEAIGRMAVEYLIGKGCQHVVFMNHDPQHTMLVQRGKAFAATAKSRHLAVTTWVATGSVEDTDQRWTSAWMRPALGALVEQMLASRERPEGIFIPSDHQAMFIHGLLRERGVIPGKDLHLISCGNTETWLSAMSPRPASIDPGVEQEGRELIRRLLARIDHPYEETVTIRVHPRLMEPLHP